MNYYLAVDHTSENKKPWTFVTLEPKYGRDKLDVRMVRNWIILNQSIFKNVWNIHIMKRTKKDTYESIEYVTPNGCSYETKDPMKFVKDADFEPINTVFI